MPNLYVELCQSVLGVRMAEDIQMKGFGVKIGPNLDMGVPGVVQSAGGCRGSTVHPSASGGLNSPLVGLPGDLRGQ